MALAGATLAQSSFTIRRPIEGSSVREVVDVRIPVGSIPRGAGFVGIWVNGRFLEAVSPFPQPGVNTSGSDFIYKLDTKAYKIPDGQMTIEAVLYANRGNFTQPINKTSVVVRLDNSASIRVPVNGLVLRYPFTPNTEYVYGVEFKRTIQSLTDAQNQLGSRAGEIESQPEKFRYRMTVMNRYAQANGTREGLMLMQPIPPRGQDFAMLTLAGEASAKKYYDYMMAPLYMRLASNGREIYGAWPFYSPSGASFGDSSRLDLVAMLPLPILPSGGIRPGRPFPGFLPQSTIDLTKAYDIEKFTTLIQGRGTLEGIEYERGRPCVKVRNVIAQGEAATGVQEFDETYWFALDMGMPIRIERRYTITMRVREQIGGGGGGAQQGGAPQGGPGRAGGRGTDTSDDGGREGRMMTPGLPEPAADGSIRLTGAGLLFSPTLFQAGQGARGGSLDGGPGGGGGQAVQGGGGGGGGGARTRTRIVRQRTVISMVME